MMMKRRLVAGDVHVWRIAIGPELPTGRYWTLLSPDEQARASALRHATHRAAYVCAHGAMRTILAEYARSAPEQLRFHAGEFGKPALAPDENIGRLEFNLAHSGDLALLAVAGDRAVGIDIARRESGVDHAGIAARCFSPAERQALQRLGGTPEGAVNAFYAAWTLKEAYVKATGTGLSRGLDTFDVSFAPGESPALIADRLDVGAPSLWQLFALEAPEGYSAALVVAKPAGDIVLLDAAEPDADATLVRYGGGPASRGSAR